MKAPGQVKEQKKDKSSQPRQTKSVQRDLFAQLHPLHSTILNLQQGYGNRYVQRLIQTKLKIGQPGDKYEQEADRVAEQVMRMPESACLECEKEQPIRRKPAIIHLSVQRQVEKEDEEERVQPKSITLLTNYSIIRKQANEEKKEEEEVAQAKPLAEQITPLVQRQVEEEEEEEPVQAKSISTQNIFPVQRQAEEEEKEEEPIQTKPLVGQITPLVQKQAEEEEKMEEEPVQAKSIAAQIAPSVQRQAEDEEEEEEPIQPKSIGSQMTPLVQRQAEEEKEEEEPVQTKPSFEQIIPSIQRQVAKEEEEKEEEPVQTQRSSGKTSTVTSGLESGINAMKGRGRPLDTDTRAFFEPRFGVDFSGVRVHTGTEAVEMNRRLNSQAFTHGRDIYFSSGRYNPATPSGKRLLAHELTHVVQQVGDVQRYPASKLAISEKTPVRIQGIWGWIKKKVKKIWGGIKGIAKSTWNAVKRAGSLAVSVAKKLGKGAANLIKKYGGKVVGFLSRWGRRAIGWIKKWGTRVIGWIKRWGISVIGWIKKWGTRVIGWLRRWGTRVIGWLRRWGTRVIGWLRRWGTRVIVWLKVYISAFPKRLWRIVVHRWNTLTGTLRWLWTGLKGIAQAAWSALKGIFSWLNSGLSGAFSWLRSGIISGVKWVIDFIKQPSMEKLKEGLLATLSWLGKGVKGLASWGWKGVVGAAIWAQKGMIGLAKWLWNRYIGRAEWAGRMIVYLLDVAGLPEILQIVWEAFNHTRALNSAEIAASQQVHKSGLISYSLVRVDENSLLTRFNGMRPFVSFHIIHYPGSSLSPEAVVHELTHVAQYEKVGAVYALEALYAQEVGKGYNYGDLAKAITNGKRFSDFNREQQATICEDYYLAKNKRSTLYGGSESDLKHYVDQMNKGEF
jgi:hypothetical protein